jgi:O-antigen/teichoic acid export membrane protein
MIKDKFLKGSALLFVSMMTGNVFGYLFQLAMGRMLSVEAYGEMNALMSLLVLFGIPFATVINFFAKETAVHSNKGADGLSEIKGLHKYGMIKTCLFILPIIVLLGFSSPLIGNFLEISFEKVILILVCVFAAALLTVNTGIIQGLQYFRSLSFIGAGTSVFKFFFGILFVWLGFGVNGALSGLLSTSLILLVFSQWKIVSSMPKNNKTFHIPFKEIYSYVGGLFMANIFFGLMTQADVMLIKHYFPAKEAGLYASAAILGKAIMYLPYAIVMALFPMVAANHAAGHSSSKMFSKAVGLTLLLSGSGAVILFLHADYFMGVLFGERFLQAAPITARFGIAMLPMAFILLLMNYLLAQGKTYFVFFMAFAAVIELAGIHFYRQNLHNVLYVITATGCLALFPMAVTVVLQQRSRR